MCTPVNKKKDTWRPRYGNDSRSWLITGNDEETCFCPPATTTQESYPQIKNIKPQATRKKLLENFLMKEIAEELKMEMMQELEEEEKVTEYNDQFAKEGFDPSKLKERTEKDLENYLKYPLYYDAPRTAWMDKIDTLQGKTQSANNMPLALFRRNGSFTKPLTHVLDIPKPGSIGYM